MNRPTFKDEPRKGGLKVINQGKGKPKQPEPKQNEEGKADADKS